MSTQYFRFSAHRAAEPLRCALLERLLARSDESMSITDWRADAYELIAGKTAAMPGLAAVALRAAADSAGTGGSDGAEVSVVAGDMGAPRTVLFATPVCYLADMTQVRMAADGLPEVSPAEAGILAADFNRIWHDAGVRLIRGACAQLFCVMDESAPTETRDPREVLDRNIENELPAGRGGARLRGLMSEIEMWLFDHAVNRARRSAAAPPLTGLWLWGGGALLKSLPRVQGWTAGNDPFFGAFATNRTDAAADPGGAERGAAGRGSGVIVIAGAPGSAPWRDAEARWLAPALEQLRSGGLARLQLSAGGRCHTVGPRWRQRFWRRPRPWWESFA